MIVVVNSTSTQRGAMMSKVKKDTIKEKVVGINIHTENMDQETR